MPEMLDIYDEHRNKTGKIIERNTHIALCKGEYIIQVHCWIIRSDKKLLLTQRRFDKNRGGLWECTGGAVQSGENSIEAIQRELNEELGIDVNPEELKLSRTLKIENKNIFMDIYVVYKDISIESISFTDGEVIDCKYVTIEELKEMFGKGEIGFSKNNLSYIMSLI